MIIQLSKDKIWFPAPELADEDGLLAIGGDLSAKRLLLAYRNGIFPWFSEGDPILWYAPNERFVLFPEKLKVSSSMHKILRSGSFRITYDQAFTGVINACANSGRKDQEGTWITDTMKSAYIHLYNLGYAHSVEVWENDLLVGGLYGVQINHVFCGESMFSNVSNASKAALISLCQHKTFKLIDCQVYTSHLKSMGADFISLEEYLVFLNDI
ncbi:leucyl/phenylalanyl-tRNA--protein transferase [Daejeonella sp.]|uniref:leucyl/phenylalanyl-tRNA--protein transferase n=1 Tax=Daejeonella sp. TaxID=2805397 RepID=UPI0027220CE4|nr:leucyl/phenylalanyl-tRNA--protein transferase [Daejeonella sp.]MDO8992125.1 leucyl/phenylalanyl-tRNA--protein transferase [Daejeonella sp.]MDP2412278.1 leucyl/phenylalanyl-tRNA--protein transferase [Daejeonella sp.]